MLRNPAIGTGAQQQELDSLLQANMERMGDERYAFLMIQPADIANNRLEFLPQPKALTQRFFIFVFIIKSFDPVLARDMPVNFRVPMIVIDSVENAAKLIPMGV